MKSKTNYILGLLLLLFSEFTPTFAQKDQTFWFAIPKETFYHKDITATQNVSFKLAAFSIDAHVKISMPANPDFKTRSFTILGNTSHVEILAVDWTQFDSIYANPSVLVSDPPITGKNNRGILIESDNDITVYYDYDNLQNRQLFSLKGKNALGTDFYTSFQNIWINSYKDNIPGKGLDNAFSDIDIVATEDNTTIWVTPTVIFQGRADLTPFSVVLNRGETYSLVASSASAAGHPLGTRITSNKPIAVTVNDDSVQMAGPGQGCKDIIGDQIVPTSVIGTKYIVMCGNETTRHSSVNTRDSLRGEQIFVTSVHDNDTVKFMNTLGIVLQKKILNKGQSDYFSPDINIPEQNAIYIECSDSSYVFHITGIGCELGGALLPKITGCTGSTEVVFYRSSTVAEFTMNLMIPYDTTKSFSAADQSYNFFKLVYSDGHTEPILASWFEPIPAAGWAVLKMDKRSMGSIIPSNEAVKIINTKDFFHMGMTNGETPKTNKYGYFSSYNAEDISAMVKSPDHPENPWQDKIIGCFGEIIILKATGGLEYTWHFGSKTGPPTFLSDPQSANPRVSCPEGVSTFFVAIKRAKCFGNDTLQVQVTIWPKPVVDFELDKFYGCAPMNINISNVTSGANSFEWSIRKDNGKDIVFIPPVPMSDSMKFPQPDAGNFENIAFPYKPIVYSFLLKASYNNYCKDSLRKDLVIYPQLNANFFPVDTVGCNPMRVNFNNLSNGNVTDTSYNWEYGDGGSSRQKFPSHTYTNMFKSSDIVDTVTLIATSPYYCRDTARTTITVHPFLKAGFTVDTVRGCSPLTIKITNNSLNKGAIFNYEWDFGDGTSRILPAWQDTLMHTYTLSDNDTLPDTLRLRLRVNPKYANPPGCYDELTRNIIVYPPTKISFIPDPNGSDLCDSTRVKFTTTSTAAIKSFLWTFGDGSSSTSKDITHLFTNHTLGVVSDTVRLTGISKEYCNADTFKVFKVHPFLDPQFGVDTSKICAPKNVTITNISQGGVQNWKWDFGDGSPAYLLKDPPVHLYGNPGTDSVHRTIRLTMSNNGGGCTKSLSRMLIVYPEINADFFTPDTMGCNPLKTTFTNKSTYVNNSNPVAKYFTWSFGDSIYSTLKDPVHIYENITANDVDFNLKLTTSSVYGCYASKSRKIKVYAFIKAQFHVSDSTSCAPFDATIYNESRGGITKYIWNFNDGSAVSNTSALTFKHRYTGLFGELDFKFPLHLEVQNSHGCVDTLTRPVLTYPEVKALFTPSKIIGCHPFTVTFTPDTIASNAKYYSWDFDDGTSSDAKMITHVFTNTDNIDKVYNVKLTATSVFQCSNQIIKQIRVLPFIKADFSVDDAHGCSPFKVKIHNSSVGSSNEYTWNYGDNSALDVGNSATDKTHTFLNNSTIPGNPAVLTRNISLVIRDINSQCKDTMKLPIEVYPEVKAAFNTNNVKQGCNPLSIQFKDTSALIDIPDTYAWDFGDATSEKAKDPAHTYTNLDSTDRTYYPKLIVVSQHQCSDTIKDSIKVFPFLKADFTIDEAKGCSPLKVKFTNATSPGNFEYAFDDGNGGFSIGIPDTVTYIDPNATGNAPFTPKLTVTYKKNNIVCPDAASRDIIVYPKVNAIISADVLSGCQPLTVNFEDATVFDATRTWYFGDKAKGIEKNQKHVYNNFSNGLETYIVSLYAVSINQCKDSTDTVVTVYPKPKAKFSLDTIEHCPPFKVNILNYSEAANTYTWSFGDGSQDVISTEKIKINHTYENMNNTDDAAYYLTLTASNDGNCTDVLTQTITVYPRVVSEFEPDIAGCSPMIVPFVNTSRGADKSYWDFGDGYTSHQVSLSHRYFNGGVKDTTFTVTLIDSSYKGCSDVKQHFVTVYPQPAADFSTSATLTYPDSKVIIMNHTPNPDVWNYHWTFGDQTDPIDYVPTFHDYLTWGSYDITMTVSNAKCTDNITRTVRILAPQPIAGFTSSGNGCVPDTVTFTDLSINYTENSTFQPKYKWQFGDNSADSVSTEQNPTHVFEKAGKYYVRQTVYGDEGNMDYLLQEIEIYPLPVVNFTLDPNLVMLPDATVKFYNTSKFGVKYIWNFGDNEQSGDAEPTHTYKELGVYDVSLYVETEHQCHDIKQLLKAVHVVGAGEIIFPNVFKPDQSGPGDGRYNSKSERTIEVFHPHFDGVSEYNLEIYDRWGEKLFESKDVNIGWDGYYKGKLCKTDVYIWKAKGKFTNGKTFDKAGDVTLLR